MSSSPTTHQQHHHQDIYQDTSGQFFQQIKFIYKFKSKIIESLVGMAQKVELNLLYWSERRCADGFVESAVGHYFWYFSTLLVLTTVAKLA
jgi:hypothetical protein